MAVTILYSENHQCMFCDFNVHNKEVLLRHIRDEHWDKIARKVKRR